MSSPVLLLISARRAVTRADFEHIRLLRNAGREWMEDTRELDQAEQERFRATCPTPIWLYESGKVVVGFGMVSARLDGRQYVTLAVAPEQRGLGIGGTIYADLLDRVGGDVWAVCRATNTASCRAALRAGFVQVQGGPDGWVTLKAQGRQQQQS